MASADGVVVESSRKEILDAHAHISNLIFSHINSMSIKCAIELDIPEVIHKHGKAMPLSELSDALRINGAKSDGLRRLMRILVHSKLFTLVNSEDEREEVEDVYALTGASRLLLRGEPLSLAPLSLMIFNPIMMDPFQRMSDWFRDECATPFETKHGRPIWEFAGGDGRWNALFNEGMASDSGLVSYILGNDGRHIFKGLKSVVDVAGGTGAMARGLAAAFLDLKFTVMDLPHVVSGLESDDRLSFVSGNMFDSVPQADAVILKWILHDWSDEDCVKILGKCREAITPRKNNGGKVIIVEMVVEDRKHDIETTETQLFNDLLMMISTKGKERTEKEWATIFIAAGFASYKISPVLGLRSIIEVFP